MAGVILEFEVYGEKQVVRELARFSDMSLDAQAAFEAIAEKMKEDIQEQFDTEGRSMSGGWAPLKPETLAAKENAGLRTEIMRATDRLMDSLTDARNSDQIFEATPEGLRFGSTVPYGVYHMGPARDGSRPARKPVDFTEAQRKAYVKILQKFLVGGEL